MAAQLASLLHDQPATTPAAAHRLSSRESGRALRKAEPEPPPAALESACPRLGGPRTKARDDDALLY